MIQIRNVPDRLHRSAKAKAALEGVSLSELAMRALEREVERPTVAEIAARIRRLPEVGCEVDAAALVRAERDRR